jgi:diaminohydroxyphosphoribosylaminopyrimidine deaminase/5-amino-6-(5-phosphoribosylamino)uracil reductase
MVVVDSRLETPLDAHIFIANRALYIYASIINDSKMAALEARGATVIYLPGANGKVDLPGMLRDLAKREINELHVEAGQGLNGSLLHENLVDELVVYLAPKLIGQGQGMANFGPLSELSNAIPLNFRSTAGVGPDLRIVARVHGRDAF